MSSISNSTSLPQENLLDLSIRCSSALPRIRKEISEKFLKQAHRLAHEHSYWSHCRVGKEIATIAYKEFEETIKSKYSSPEYDYFLNCSIKQQYPYFYSELANNVNNLLKQAINPESEKTT
jgi:hypothetical protein